MANSAELEKEEIVYLARSALKVLDEQELLGYRALVEAGKDASDNGTASNKLYAVVDNLLTGLMPEGKLGLIDEALKNYRK